MSSFRSLVRMTIVVLACAVWLPAAGTPSTGGADCDGEAQAKPSQFGKAEDIEDAVIVDPDRPFIAAPIETSEAAFDFEPQASTVVAGPMIVATIAVSPDGMWLLAGKGGADTAGELVMWDVENRKVVWSHQYKRGVRSVAFSADGRLVASGHWETQARVFNAQTGDLRFTLEGHNASVTSVVFTPEADLLITGSLDHSIKVWSLETGNPIKVLNGHEGPVLSVALSPDGKTIASGSEDLSVRLWDLPSGRPLRSLHGHEGAVQRAQFHPKVSLLVSATSGSTIRLWDPQTGRDVNQLDGHNREVNAVTFSPNGRQLASGCDDGHVKLWDVDSRRQTNDIQAHYSNVSALAFGPNNDWFASSSWDASIKIWDTKTSALLAELKQETVDRDLQAIVAMACSPDGKQLAVTRQSGEIQVRDAVTGATRFLLKGHRAAVHGVAFDPTGKSLASVGEDKQIMIWDLTSGTVRLTLPVQKQALWAVAYSRDGKLLATAGDEQEIQIWDAETGMSEMTLTGDIGAIRSLQFSRNGGQLISAGTDSVVRIWSVKAQREISTLDVRQNYAQEDKQIQRVAFDWIGRRTAYDLGQGPIRLWSTHDEEEVQQCSGPEFRVTSMMFFCEGALLAAGGDDNLVRIWDVETGDLRSVLRGNNRAVDNLVYSPKTKTLFSGSIDGSIRSWKARQPKLEAVHTLPLDAGETKFVLFSAEGEGLITGGTEKQIQVWDLSKGEVQRKIEGHRAAVTCAALSPDGEELVSGSWDRTVRIWDVESGRSLGVLKGNTLAVNCVAFSPDGTTVAAGGADRMLRLWELPDEKPRFKSSEQDKPITSICFSKDGELILTGTGDWKAWKEPGEVKLWSARTGEEIGTVSTHATQINAAAFSPDGQRIATATADGHLRIFNTSSRELMTDIAAGPGVRHFAWFPDGERIAVGQYPGIVGVWDANTGQQRIHYAGHDKLVNKVAVSPNSKVIVSVGSDGTAKFWPVSEDQ